MKDMEFNLNLNLKKLVLLLQMHLGLSCLNRNRHLSLHLKLLREDRQHLLQVINQSYFEVKVKMPYKQEAVAIVVMKPGAFFLWAHSLVLVVYVLVHNLQIPFHRDYNFDLLLHKSDDFHLLLAFIALYLLLHGY